MIDLGKHAVFMIWAYAGVTVVVLALIGWVVIRARGVEHRLKQLESLGIRRRSAGTGS